METIDIEENRKKNELTVVGICPMSVAAEVLKRIFDIVLSAFGCLLWSPFFLVIWVAIKLEDGGNAIFKQERIGYHGKPFLIYKFRSMRVIAEQKGHPQLCKEDDSRLTHVGKFIRQHHLDELPVVEHLEGGYEFCGSPS